MAFQRPRIHPWTECLANSIADIDMTNPMICDSPDLLILQLVERFDVSNRVAWRRLQ